MFRPVEFCWVGLFCLFQSTVGKDEPALHRLAPKLGKKRYSVGSVDDDRVLGSGFIFHTRIYSGLADQKGYMSRISQVRLRWQSDPALGVLYRLSLRW